MIDTALLVAIFAVAVAILVVAGAVLVAVKTGFNQVILGLRSIDDRLDDSTP